MRRRARELEARSLHGRRAEPRVWDAQQVIAVRELWIGAQRSAVLDHARGNPAGLEERLDRGRVAGAGPVAQLGIERRLVRAPRLGAGESRVAGKLGTL